ncbi:MAG: FHA domain-containing protein [Verrucomicrobia bacterium]|nr:FHA domain-containing protein [Verrucomicrobiota bacterium]
MIQLKILSGRQAGAQTTVENFPCLIGRAGGAQLQLDDPGVWEKHLELDLKFPDGFELRLLGGALATVNGEAFQSRRLRNGDVIELGGARLQFWLGEVAQPGLRGRENLVWLALAALMLAEAGLVFWLGL